MPAGNKKGSHINAENLRRGSQPAKKKAEKLAGETTNAKEDTVIDPRVDVKKLQALDVDNEEEVQAFLDNLGEDGIEVLQNLDRNLGLARAKKYNSIKSKNKKVLHKISDRSMTPKGKPKTKGEKLNEKTPVVEDKKTAGEKLQAGEEKNKTEPPKNVEPPKKIDVVSPKGKKYKIPKHIEDFGKFMNQFDSDKDFQKFLDANRENKAFADWLSGFGTEEDFEKYVSEYQERLKKDYGRKPLDDENKRTLAAHLSRVNQLSKERKKLVTEGRLNLAAADILQSTPEAQGAKAEIEGTANQNKTGDEDKDKGKGKKAKGFVDLSEGKTVLPPGAKPFQVPEYTAQQYKRMNEFGERLGPDSYLSRLAGGDEALFNELEEPSRKKFNELQGSTASRFSAMGAGGRRSSGFRNTMTQANQDYQAQLQAQRMALRRQAGEDLTSQTNQFLGLRPESRGFVQPPPKVKQEGTNPWETGAKILESGAKIVGSIAGFG